MIKVFTDEELVQKAIKDVSYFETLMQRYEPKLKRYIYKISNFCEATVEEILQDTFLNIWKNLKGFDSNLKFSSWIYQIARNETLSLYRKFKARGQHRKINLDIGDEILTNIDAMFDLPKEMNQQINQKIIQKVFSMMKPKYREVLILKFMEDMSYDEIADILQIPMGTVATFMNRAKKEFKAILARQRIDF
jgi:RNA polymerase sigma-70 factor (ECF subfamily)